MRFETPPSQQAQVDWAELGRHEHCGREVALHLFVMVLGFSGTLYAEAVSAADLPTFLACLESAFERAWPRSGSPPGVAQLPQHCRRGTEAASQDRHAAS